VRVRLADGTKLEVTRTNAKGDPEAPLSHADMVAKARMLLAHGQVPDADRVIDGILGLASGGSLPDLGVI
jgi:hypothetical protein